jgi:hypothetical protein
MVQLPKTSTEAHIEWFQIDIETASLIFHFWSRWMERADPYDKRGTLTAFWKLSSALSIDFIFQL